MLNITENLLPHLLYSFLTAEHGRTNPCEIKTFLNSTYSKDQIISVSDWIGPDTTLIWSVYEGWNKDVYSKFVSTLVSLIDSKDEVNSEFIDSALNDNLSVYAAVGSWFLGTDVFVEVIPHAEGTTGYVDIEIDSIYGHSRLVLPLDIKNGESVNVYYGGGSKSGVTWKSDVKTTLRNFYNN